MSPRGGLNHLNKCIVPHMLSTRSNSVQCKWFLNIIMMALIITIKIWYGKKCLMFQKLAQLALPLSEHFHFLLYIIFFCTYLSISSYAALSLLCEQTSARSYPGLIWSIWHSLLRFGFITFLRKTLTEM